MAAADALRAIVECGLEKASAFGPSEAGNVEWAPHNGRIACASQTGGFGLAIPRNGANPEAAFLRMKWLTARERDLAVAMAGGNPSRFSTCANEVLIAQDP